MKITQTEKRVRLDSFFRLIIIFYVFFLRMNQIAVP